MFKAVLDGAGRLVKDAVVEVSFLVLKKTESTVDRGHHQHSDEA